MAHTIAHRQRAKQIAQTAAGIGWRFHQDRAQQIDDGIETCVVRGITRNIAGRELAEFARSAFFVAVHDQIAAIVQRREIGDRPQHALQPMTREIHLANDLGIQKADGITRDGIAKTGMEFIRDRSATDNTAPLQHADSVSGLRQIKRTGEPVMPTADQNGIIRLARHKFLSNEPLL